MPSSRPVEIQRSPSGAWDLWVDGRVVIHDESYGVVTGVEEALLGGGDPMSEVAEVARAIPRRII